MCDGSELNLPSSPIFNGAGRYLPNLTDDRFIQGDTAIGSTGGINDSDQNLPEYRAFLDFPLDGSTGGEVIPINARIVSATLEVFINEVSFAPIVPTLLDLVSYPINGLRVEDFDSFPLMSQSLDFFAADLGTIVSIDVTPLMQEAQRLGVPDFQVRFVLDFETDVGFVGIEDLPFDPSTAPLLTVRYVPR